jgi:DNA/RNA endonuclease G (NUC1)
MRPSADRNNTKENNAETFVMSNMQPQTLRLNRQTWATLSVNWRDPKFLTTIGAIEKATEFDFFSELPDKIEK